MSVPFDSSGKYGRLWASQPPLPCESRASWIQRLCGDHQYSFAVLDRVLGFLPRRSDWDIVLENSLWLRILGMAGLSEEAAHRDMNVLPALSQSALPGVLTLSVKGMPRYRWCGACFSSDRTPYLRWYWRLSGVRECWVHHVPLNERCHVCQQLFLVNTARLTGRSALSLAECPRCGIGLAEVHDATIHYDRGVQRSLQAVLEQVWSKGRIESEEEAAEVVVKYLKVLRVVMARSKTSPDGRRLSRGHRRDRAGPEPKPDTSRERVRVRRDADENGTKTSFPSPEQKESSPSHERDGSSTAQDSKPAIPTPEARARSRSAANLKRIQALPKPDKGWKLKADSFRDPVVSQESAAAFRVPWQWKLSAQRRMAVADAIWKVRKELRMDAAKREGQAV